MFLIEVEDSHLNTTQAHLDACHRWKFKIIKANYQQNKPNKISFNLFLKVSVKFPNLWFGAVHR